MSIFTLRNHVKQIRDKTYIELIKTYYKVGYMLKKASWVNMKSTIPYPKVFQNIIRQLDFKYSSTWFFIITNNI